MNKITSNFEQHAKETASYFTRENGNLESVSDSMLKPNCHNKRKDDSKRDEPSPKKFASESQILMEVDSNSTGNVTRKLSSKDISTESDLEDGEIDDDEEYNEGEISETGNGNTEKSTDDQNDDTDKPEGLIEFKLKKVLKHSYPSTSMGPLPEGWSEVTHECGMPIYWNTHTKVVTWSRPYTLRGNLVKHEAPLASIPCLGYKKYKEKLKESVPITSKQENETDCVNGAESNPDSNNQDNLNQPIPKVVLHSATVPTLRPDEMNEYLSKQFTFETLKIPHFEKWSQRRKYNSKMRKQKLEEAVEKEEKNKNNPGSHITLTVEGDSAGKTKKVTLTTNGKPMICILHEYAQRFLKKHPKYIFKENEDSLEPFQATITLDGKEYASASAINKKKAKNKAALETLEMLIPGFKNQLEMVSDSSDLSYFNDVSITDHRVYDLCTHTGHVTPYQLLSECLKRNQGINDVGIHYEVQQGGKKSLNFVMRCGKHEYMGTAKNKKTGKQLGAQHLLKMLHPHLNLYSDIVKLYGKTTAQERARKKQEEQEIFDLKQRRILVDNAQEEKSRSSDQSNNLEPNPELLAKLKEMMMKLGEKKSEKPTISPMAAALSTGSDWKNDPPTLEKWHEDLPPVFRKMKSEQISPNKTSV